MVCDTWPCQVDRGMRHYAEAIVSDLEDSTTILHEAIASDDWEKIYNALKDVKRNLMDLEAWIGLWYMVDYLLVEWGELKDERKVEKVKKVGYENLVKLLGG